jgi:7-cyano-7-deazaguanine synthase
MAIVLVSGGLDSCVTAAIANEHYRLAFVHVNYGQITETRELKAFLDIADYYGVFERLIADIAYLRKIGGSSLTDPRLSIPQNGVRSDDIPNTYVPFRNTHLIAVAVSWAEVIRAERIFIGANEMDSSGYPDCRQRYFEVYNRLIKEGTRGEGEIEIITPLINLKKGEIVKKGIQLKAPLHLTWSCYLAEDIACGRCDSCILRLEGFRSAGATDPIPYRSY